MIDILLSQFTLSGRALRNFQHWSEGFDGYDQGLPREQFRGAAIRGWDSSKAMSELKARYPRVSFKERSITVQFASV